MFTRNTLIVAGILGFVSAQLGQAAVVFDGIDGTRQARVTFDISGSNLLVKLENNASTDVGVPIDLLGAVFFNIAGDPALTPVSANLSAGSGVYLGGVLQTTPPQSGTGAFGVGGEWAYARSISSSDPDLSLVNQGISGAGLDIFGPGDRFSTDAAANLEGPDSPDGVQYLILSAGDNLATGNPNVNSNFLIKSGLDFVLSGLPVGFSLNDINDVVFQYGTGLDEPSFPGDGGDGSVPEPASLGLVIVAGAGLLMRRRRTA